MKGLSVRLLIIVAAVLALVYFKPDLVKKAPYGEQVVTYRNQVLGASTEVPAIPVKIPAVDWVGAMNTVKGVKLPQNPFTGEPKEVSVEELAGQLGEQLKRLPAEKAREVKVNFCQDVIDD